MSKSLDKNATKYYSRPPKVTDYVKNFHHRTNKLQDNRVITHERLSNLEDELIKVSYTIDQVTSDVDLLKDELIKIVNLLNYINS